MLDEMTAALPADLTERVLEVIGAQRGPDRCVIFISHRMIEIAAVCDRATVLREGETVGVVDVNEGSEERIVALMLGDIVKGMPARAARDRPAAVGAAAGEPRVPRIRATSLPSGTKLEDVSFDLFAGEVLGVVALEGQGQDELFDILAGSEHQDGGELAVDGRTGLLPPPGRRHPGRARLRAGGPGRGAPDAALGPREHRAAVHRAASRVGADRHGRGTEAGRRGDRARSRSTRAPSPRSGGCRAATSRR